MRRRQRVTLITVHGSQIMERLVVLRGVLFIERCGKREVIGRIKRLDLRHMNGPIMILIGLTRSLALRPTASRTC